MVRVETSLQDRWVVLAMRWGARRPGAEAGFASIASRYGEAQRRYHTLDHIGAVLATIDELLEVEPVDDPAAVLLAGWLHDIVYDPTRSDNEAQSAVYARRALSIIRVPVATTDETARLIELTAGHVVEEGDRNAVVLVDADLAILGAPPADYDRYAADIRDEYGHVDDDAYRSGRRAILESFLARPRLFHTDTAHARFDGAARANLRREIASLD